MDVVVMVVIHHDESFVNHPTFDCVGGSVIEVDDIDVDKISYFGIIDKLNELGYNNVDKVHWGTRKRFEA